MTARRVRGRSSSGIAARSGSGWPASGYGPSAARASSGRVSRRIAQVASPASDAGRPTVGPVIALHDGRRPPRGDARPRRRRLVCTARRALGDPRPQRIGKTTLLTLAGARLWPSSGAVEILGSRLGRVDVRTLRPRISLVSGSVTRQLRADLPARDVVVSGRLRRARDLVAPLLRRGLGGGRSPARRGRLRRHRDTPLRRDLRGRASAGAPGPGAHGPPELLLLDEPAAGLDLGARERLVSRLGALAADPASPDHGARHPPLRGDPAGLHSCRLGAPGKARGRRLVGGRRHLVPCLGLLRRAPSRSV